MSISRCFFPALSSKFVVVRYEIFLYNTCRFTDRLLFGGLSMIARNDRPLGDLIAQGRKNHKLTQEKLAEIVNVEYRTIQRWECGESTPRPSKIETLAYTFPEVREPLMRAFQKKYTSIEFCLSCVKDFSAFSHWLDMPNSKIYNVTFLKRSTVNKTLYHTYITQAERKERCSA